MPPKITQLPASLSGRHTDCDQLNLALEVHRQVERDGVGMGVLSDGTPFLTGRGLARLVDIENLHIRTISLEWEENPPKPRVAGIKSILESRGINLPSPHIEVRFGNRVVHAFTAEVCLAVLEYYAFDAQKVREAARKNYRLLAGRQLQDFIYAQVGYDPENNLSPAWQQFHDRVSLNFNAVPKGYFSVFKEIADIIVTLGQAGLHLDEKFVPDISVGRSWSDHWKKNRLEDRFGPRREYSHNYPEYFPQAASNPQKPYCYPEAALGEFRRWVREDYLEGGKFKKYLNNKVKSKELPASFAQLALSAYSTDEEADE